LAKIEIEKLHGIRTMLVNGIVKTGMKRKKAPGPVPRMIVGVFDLIKMTSHGMDPRRNLTNLGSSPKVSRGSSLKVNLGSSLKVNLGTGPKVSHGTGPKVNLGAGPKVNLGSQKSLPHLVQTRRGLDLTNSTNLGVEIVMTRNTLLKNSKETIIQSLEVGRRMTALDQMNVETGVIGKVSRMENSLLNAETPTTLSPERKEGKKRTNGIYRLKVTALINDQRTEN